MTIKKTAAKAVAGVLAAGVCLTGTAFAEETDIADVYTDTAEESLAEQYAFSNVSLGVENDWVLYVQQLLHIVGFSNQMDGIFESSTEEYLKQFQSMKGIYPDGICGPVTLAALEEAAFGAATTDTSEAAPAPEPTPAPEPAPAPEPTPAPAVQPAEANLAIGDSNDSVAALQQQLINLGYLNISAPDGIFGSLTDAAVKAFQTANGIYADGVVGPTTRGVLNAAPTPTPAPTPEPTPEPTPAPTPVADVQPAEPNLALGDSNEYVTALQQQLINLGYLNITAPDGIFGNLTDAAVKAFQTANGIYADGVVGPTTRGVLNAAPAPEPASTPEPTPALEPAPEPENQNLSVGVSNDQVTALQQRLIDLGYLSISAPDGTFGSLTETAVKEFQSANGIYSDGIAGPITIAAVNSGSAVSSVQNQVSNAAISVLNQVGWDIKSAYDWVVNTTFNASVTGTTTSAAALATLNSGSGDCTSRAAAFVAMARELGYQAKVVIGKVPYTNGNLAEHSWAEVKIDGKTLVCDPDFEWETKKNGYMFNYGASGTYVYQDMRDYPE